MPNRVKEVLRYFLRNPHAEGVTRWRLRAAEVQRTVKESSEAINWLVAQGFLTRDSLDSAQPVFRLDLDRAAEAKRLLTRNPNSARAKVRAR